MINNKIDYYTELVKFDKEYCCEYAESFWTVEEDDFFEGWLHEISYEKTKKFNQNVKVFANADGTGSRYAFWFTDGNKNKNEAPIICYGSEGDITLVVENIKDLIKMLSYGCESLYGSFYHGFYKDIYKDYDNFLEYFISYLPHFLTFREWMKENLDIEPVSIENLKNSKNGECKEIVELHEKAQKKYKDSFTKWQNQFFSSIWD